MYYVLLNLLGVVNIIVQKGIISGRLFILACKVFGSIFPYLGK